MSDKKPKKPGDGAYNRRRPFKRLSELDKARLENATTRHLNNKIVDNSIKLQKDIDRADTTYRKKAKQIKTVQQQTNRAINKLNKAQWKLRAAQKVGGARGTIVGALGYAVADKYLTPLAEKAGAKLGKWLKSKVKPGSTHPRKKDYVMGNNGNWVKRTAYKSKK
jgi:hypothetical protein